MLAAATTLYLVSPGGARYAMYGWRPSASVAPTLVDWLGDKTRALFLVNAVGKGASPGPGVADRGWV